MLPVLSLLAALVSAHAQQVDSEQGFDGHGFVLAAFDGDPRDAVTVPRPGRVTTGEWFFGALLEYAHAPVVRVGADGEAVPALDHLVTMNVSGGAAVHDRVRLDVALPVHLSSVDADRAWQGVLLGDVRASALVSILRPDGADEGVGLGLVLHADLPTGSPGYLLGRRSVSGGAQATASLAMGRWTVSGALGVQLEPRIALVNLTNPHRLLVGGAVGYLLGAADALTLEGRGTPPLVSARQRGAEAPAELMLSYRHRHPLGGHLLVGLGAGLPQGVGAARVRLVVGGGFGRLAREDVEDGDGDGVVGKLDACPDDPEVLNGYRDEDGCPDALGTLSVRVVWAGAPMAEVPVTLRGETGRELSVVTDERGAFTLSGVIPGTVWTARAAVGCLSQGDTVAVRDQDTVVVLALEAERPRRVRVEVPGGAGAEVRWTSERPGCVPEAAGVLDEAGTAEVLVGGGTHVLEVVLPGGTALRREVTVEAPEQTVRFDLDPR